MRGLVTMKTRLKRIKRYRKLMEKGKTVKRKIRTGKE